MDKIIATIVTFNRKKDLEKCLCALSKQTYKDFDVLVVNNGSTDGTKEYLESLGESIITINQENLGGAGGFYTGMKYMYDHGYDWLWMMDDDGLPDEKQLEELYKYGEKGNMVLNAIVINKDDHSRLAFSIMNPVDICKKQLTDSLFHPFNGTFIHRSVIDKIGFIKKEMFIWGDEQEYLRRIKSNGIIPQTVTSAKHYHPQEKGKRLYVFPFIHNNYYILDKPKHLSKIYYRNLGYINKTYRPHWYTGIGTVGRFIIAFLWRLRFDDIYIFLKYYIRGLNNNFNL